MYHSECFQSVPDRRDLVPPDSQTKDTAHVLHGRFITPMSIFTQPHQFNLQPRDVMVAHSPQPHPTLLVKTTSSRLLELPTELIQRIINCIERISSEESHQTRKKREERVFHDAYPMTGNSEEECYTACHDEEPILNSLQAFSVVNKAIYELCRPRLWKVR